MLKLILPLAIAALFAYQYAEAQERPLNFGASIDAREAHQRDAIRSGIRSGELTPREAGRLNREQARIERHEQMARSDGRFTPRERARIQHELDRSARHIWHETHDRQRVSAHGGFHDGHHGFGHDRGRHYGWQRGRS